MQALGVLTRPIGDYPDAHGTPIKLRDQQEFGDKTGGETNIDWRRQNGDDQVARLVNQVVDLRPVQSGRRVDNDVPGFQWNALLPAPGDA